MDTIRVLNHTTWTCNYHVVFIPKCRRRVLFGQLRQSLGQIFHELARQKESQILEGHIMPDHVHRLIAIPPKYAVSQVVGFIKGKSAIHLARSKTKCNTSTVYGVAMGKCYEQLKPEERATVMLMEREGASLID